jgi:hypothetical protein
VGHAAQSRPYLTGQGWTSRAGPSLRYAKEWHVVHRDVDELQLLTTTDDGDRVWVTVRALPSAEGSPLELLEAQVQREERNKLGFRADPEPDDVLLEPSIGFVKTFPFHASYFGTLDVPPSPSVGVECLLLAATDGNASVLVEAMTDTGPQTADNGATSPFPVFVIADELLTTISWGSAAPR